MTLVSKNNEIEELIEETIEAQQIKKIFREIAFLSKAYRDVMVMYYIDEYKIKDIATMLNLSETTVKQRLFFARNSIRKEVETMNDRELSLKPVRLEFVGTGRPCGNDPRTKVERIFSQNLIYLCKNKPRTAKELSEELCVPMPYIEEELEIQCQGENGNYGTLRKLENGKYIANILLVDYDEYEAANKIYEQQPNTSQYVQGVEVPVDYSGEIPEGFDVIELPKSKYLMFQGEPFAEEDYCIAIEEIWNAEKKYDPSVLGYDWDDSNPKIQLEPIGERGYIELLPSKEK